jgi:uncharacterized membrane protein YagU involved in acid resistance
MMPFGFAFRAAGLRINEYGPKTLALLLPDLVPPMLAIAGFVQHLVISWGAALPFLAALAPGSSRRARLLAGAAYGAGFYAAVNSLALPIAFGDPTPWELGFRTVAPSLVVHVVYGAVLALAARSGRPEVSAG